MRNGALLVLFVDELIITVTLFLFSMSSSFMVTTREPHFSSSSFEPTVCICAQLLSCVQLFETSWTLAFQFVEFSRQEYWSGLPFTTLGDLPDPGIEPASPTLAGRFFPLSHLGSPRSHYRHH